MKMEAWWSLLDKVQVWWRKGGREGRKRKRKVGTLHAPTHLIN